MQADAVSFIEKGSDPVGGGDIQHLRTNPRKLHGCASGAVPAPVTAYRGNVVPRSSAAGIAGRARGGAKGENRHKFHQVENTKKRIDFFFFLLEIRISICYSKRQNGIIIKLRRKSMKSARENSRKTHGLLNLLSASRVRRGRATSLSSFCRRAAVTFSMSERGGRT